MSNGDDKPPIPPVGPPTIDRLYSIIQNNLWLCILIAILAIVAIMKSNSENVQEKNALQQENQRRGAVTEQTFEALKLYL